ncbi:unnamed protein product [Didymodactylos carnosus]|uniref:Uncharacterized protein n=1 Tax=Didymodactylos carnosus TaxID=1234261 RepID=A0A8S2D8Q5_9BILA|nr:unnamed protein product [Didymodactylos carnosus]CAF3657015.1 unnamed protein product [Didymodactylos carnosus]
MDSFTAVGAQVSNNPISVPIPGNVFTARFDLESENVTFAYESNGLLVLANYQYLSSYLERLIRRSSGTPLNLNRICNDVCTFVFSKLKYWISLSSLKKEIRLKLLNIAKGKQKTVSSVALDAVREQNEFKFFRRSVQPLTAISQSFGNVATSADFSNTSSFEKYIDLKKTLYVRSLNLNSPDIAALQSLNTYSLEATFSLSLIEEACSTFLSSENYGCM